MRKKILCFKFRGEERNMSNKYQILINIDSILRWDERNLNWKEQKCWEFIRWLVVKIIPKLRGEKS